MYNFSKEQCTLPDDDLWIETCRSDLNVVIVFQLGILDSINFTVSAFVGVV
jgi:hypothetical protein